MHFITFDHESGPFWTMAQIIFPDMSSIMFFHSGHDKWMTKLKLYRAPLYNDFWVIDSNFQLLQLSSCNLFTGAVSFEILSHDTPWYE